jgi:hypothetical protein
MGATVLHGQFDDGIAQVTLPGEIERAVRRDASAELAAARRTLRGQIARLERELADAFVTAFPMGGLPQPSPVRASPRLLDLGELERVRDDLSERLHAARVHIGRCADEQAEKRLALEQMLLHPAEHRFTRISCRELGQPGCGVWQVRPRLGLIGMLMGWWQVKLSSGCPLPGGHGRAGRPPVARRWSGRMPGLGPHARPPAGVVRGTG